MLSLLSFQNRFQAILNEIIHQEQREMEQVRSFKCPEHREMNAHGQELTNPTPPVLFL